jgi:hypothetical protein
VEAYFGCWLDINQPIPLFPPSVDPNQIDGPFDQSPSSGNGPILSAFMNDMHQCLVAEISYDPISIPNGDNPQYSAWLAQRNLGLAPTPNPGANFVAKSSQHVRYQGHPAIAACRVEARRADVRLDCAAPRRQRLHLFAGGERGRYTGHCGFHVRRIALHPH